MSPERFVSQSLLPLVKSENNDRLKKILGNVVVVVQGEAAMLDYNAETNHSQCFLKLFTFLAILLNDSAIFICP